MPFAKQRAYSQGRPLAGKTIYQKVSQSLDLTTNQGKITTALKIRLIRQGWQANRQSHSRPIVRKNLGARLTRPEIKLKAPPTPIANLTEGILAKFWTIHFS